jgi:TP901 family phage tail tape measure protein
MPDYVIKTDFRAADRLSPVLKRLGINVEKLGNDATRSFRRASRGASVFGGVLKGVLAAGVVSRGFMYAGMGVRSLGETFLDFDKNVTSSIAKLRNNLDRSSLAFTTLGKSAREAATVTEFSAGDTSKAVEQLVMAGLNENQVLAALTPTLNLATNANIDVSEATRMAMKSLGAFGMRVDDAAQLQTNLTRVNNVFARAVSDSTLEMQDLFEVLIYAGPAMNSAGQSIETFAAMSEILADNSIDASIAGTSLRMAFLRLAGPPKEARDVIKKLNLVIKDADGNFIDFAHIVGQLEYATRKMGNVEKMAAMKKLFGVRAQNAMNILVREGADKLKAYREGLEASSGAGQRMAKIMRDSIIARLLKLKSNLIELGFKFIETFAEKGGRAIDRFTAAVSKFDPKPMIKDLKTIFGILKDYIIPNLDLVVAGFIAWEIAVSSAKWAAFLQFAQALAPALFATKGAAALLLLDSAAVLLLAGAIGLVIVKNDMFVDGFERGYTQIEIAILKVIASIKEAIPLFDQLAWAYNKVQAAKNFVLQAPTDAMNWINRKTGGPQYEQPWWAYERAGVTSAEEDRLAIWNKEKILRDLQNEDKNGPVGRGMPQRRGPQFTPDEMIARQEQLMRDLSKLDMSDPAKSVQALGYLIASADAMQMFTKGKPAEITKSEPEFKLKQPEPLKLDINVYADEGFNARYHLRSEGTKKDGRSKKAKAKSIHRLELGANR